MAVALAKYWREGLIGLLVVALLTTYWTIGNRNDVIRDLNQEITRINAITETNNKWTESSANILTGVIAEQNAGIDRVINAISQSSADIATTMDIKRVEDAKANNVLKQYINALPKATDCSIMMDNLINSGGAIKW